eukprot:TRINITY_DN1546_c1_g1_i1.p2 TRINITY_DN1546_c1_g1~~TRINITY_DN1546_c1_g1_i1.p2  ORF type:complete len:310 (-),score=28.48 TRINITY_DN1546_c1_g1_i1:1707-2636(-)
MSKYEVELWSLAGGSLLIVLASILGFVLYYLISSKEGVSIQTSARHQIAVGFSSGVLLSAGLLHMIPSAQQSAYFAFHTTVNDYPMVLLVVLVGIVLNLFVEKVLLMGKGQFVGFLPEGMGQAVILTLLLGIHSFLAGLAYGTTNGLGVLLAILAHKGVASFSLALVVCKADSDKFKKRALLAGFASSTPLGIGVGVLLGQVYKQATARIQFGALSIASGTFIEIALVHLMDMAYVPQQRSTKSQDHQDIVTPLVVDDKLEQSLSNSDDIVEDKYQSQRDYNPSMLQYAYVFFAFAVGAAIMAVLAIWV